MAKKKQKKQELKAKPLRAPQDDIDLELRLPRALASDLAEISVRSGTTTENVIRVLLGLNTYKSPR